MTWSIYSQGIRYNRHKTFG